MKDEIGEEDLRQLEELAGACLDRGEGFAWGAQPFETPEALIEEFADVVRKTFGRTPGEHTKQLCSVHKPDGEGGSIIVCHTGNGPTSEAHARFFSIAPRAVLGLVAEVRRLRR